MLGKKATIAVAVPIAVALGWALLPDSDRAPPLPQAADPDALSAAVGAAQRQLQQLLEKQRLAAAAQQQQKEGGQTLPTPEPPKRQQQQAPQPAPARTDVNPMAASVGTAAAAAGEPRPAQEGPTPAPSPRVTEAPPLLPRCSGDWQPELPLLKKAKRRLWFTGCFGGSSGATTGLNNQRQTLMSAMIIADAVGAALIYGPYSSSPHDRSELGWDSFIDVEQLAKAMPHGAVTLREAGGCVPQQATVVPFSTPWTGNDTEYNISRLTGPILAGGSDVELYTHHEFMCSGHPFWRLKKSPPGVLERADQLLAKAHHFAPDMAATGRMVVDQLRANGSKVHCVHLRTSYSKDNFDIPRVPLINCTRFVLSQSKFCRTPEAMSCYCTPKEKLRNPMMFNLIQKQFGKARLDLEKQRPSTVDFDWLVRNASRAGRLRRGDPVIIASLDHTHPRFQFLVMALHEIGAVPVTMLDIARQQTDVGARVRAAAKAPVLISAIEMAACVETDTFFPSCLSSVSEVIIDMRRWRGDAEAVEHAQLMLQILNHPDLTKLAIPERCRMMPGAPAPRSKQQKGWATIDKHKMRQKRARSLPGHTGTMQVQQK